MAKVELRTPLNKPDIGTGSRHRYRVKQGTSD